MCVCVCVCIFWLTNKFRYELYHKVKIRDEALLAAAKLSSRYIPDRFLPDKGERGGGGGGREYKERKLTTPQPLTLWTRHAQN